MSSGRRCRSAASTTPPISGCCPKIRRATSTIWAAAIASRSTGRRSSRSPSRRCGAGWNGAAIDGFRFDLAPALGRRAAGFDAQAPLFAAFAADPVLSKAKLIAEPWDIGPGGYRLGEFPEGWGEWNDRFRDAARRFWRGDVRLRGELATRLAGSHDFFSDAPAPTKSVNYVVAHDGFTLADLVSYVHKHNEDNGEHNRDGTNDNLSWNHGVEGPTDDPGILAARARDQRNLLATLFAARGAPMLIAGAELGHSQHGNNNAYAQDNAISWLDWSKADASSPPSSVASPRCAPPIPRCTRRVAKRRAGRRGRADRCRMARRRIAVRRRRPLGLALGDVLTAVFAAPGAGRGRPGAGRLQSRRAPPRCACPTTATGYVWRVRIDTGDDNRSDAPTELADRTPMAERSVLIVAETPVSATAARGPDGRDVDALADAAGIARGMVGRDGRAYAGVDRDQARAARLFRAAGAHASARARIARPLDGGDARAALAAFVDAVARQSAARDPARRPCGAARRHRISRHAEDGAVLSGSTPGADARRMRCRTGGRSTSAISTCRRCRSAGIGCEVGGVSGALTIAPPEAYRHKAVWSAALRRLSAALRAAPRRGRSGHRRFHRARPRRRGRGAARGRLFRRQPDAHAVPRRTRPR